MGSNYFGEANMGNEKGSGSSSSSSSRKGKKSNSDKPKQPQRGLGVAQLEKIRLHGQIPCAYHHPSSLRSPYPSNFNDEDPRMQIPYSSVPSSSSSFSYSSSSTSYSPSYGFQPNIVMGLPEYEKSNIIYGDSSQPTNTARWENANTSFDNQSPTPSNITIPFLNLHESQDIDTVRQRSGSGRSRSQNSESSDTQELDLELRLSL
ncbi:hypothetical protein Lal_00016454 [Lupinus albus]|uniref:Uncharacterized protein n=1 Tax=Lupinus albus TaxID=3870 RepID=A0A6A5MJH1_LUPAL|nr:hypothetical protein Lalb_Chr05g0223051 [Lupinus albus]KAF1872618.1 hypothetical protein Lal_00016454 [Lupinus albus]